MWTEVDNQFHFLWGRGDRGYLECTTGATAWRREQTGSLSGLIFSVLIPVGAVLEIGIEGLAISRLMRQTKPKLIRADSLQSSLFDLWLIGFTNLPIKGWLCFSLQQPYDSCCWIDQVKYKSRGQTFKRLLSEIHIFQGPVAVCCPVKCAWCILRAACPALVSKSSAQW